MKSLLCIALLMSSATGFAQKGNSVYLDVGVTRLGASVTYDWRLTKHCMLGAGVDVHDWRTNRINLRTSIYADLRPYWQIRRSQIFLPIDLGLSLYAERQQPFYNTVTYSKAGLHLSFGVGYHYAITKRGMGPYVSFIMKGYGFTETEYDRYNEKHVFGIYDASSLLSVGFKF